MADQIRHPDPPARSADADSVRLSLLTRLLESVAESLDLHAVLTRVATIAQEELAADGAWILHPVSIGQERAEVKVEITRDGLAPIFGVGRSISLSGSSEIIRRGFETGAPVTAGESDLDRRLVESRGVRSQIAQLVGPSGTQRWAFGLYNRVPREWTADDEALFSEVGRYVTLAIRNAEAHRRAVAEAAKLSAILDQIPEAAAIYDRRGKLERMNAAAQRESRLFALSGSPAPFRAADGHELKAEEIPPAHALKGETLRGEYLIGTGDDQRHVELREAPIRDEQDQVIGAVVLGRDVTEERQKTEKDAWRRRRAEALAGVGLDLVSAVSSEFDLSNPAQRISRAFRGHCHIYLYQANLDQLHLAGASFNGDAGEEFGRHVAAHPFRPGEGLAGTSFQIGRPLLFSEVRGDAIVDFGRNDHERELIRRLAEETLIAAPIEAYGERLGSIVVSATDPRRHFTAEDVEFVQAVAERIGAATHTSRLTRLAQEGHRAAEDLARREVDARARFEAVLESAPVGIGVVSADELRFEMANPLLTEIALRFGRISEETKVAGLRVAEVMPDMERLLKEVAEKGETRIDQALPLQRGEEVEYFNRIISPVRGRLSGTTQSLTILMQDVTSQVRSAREMEVLAQMMEERSARLDSILGSMTDALWVYDATGTVIDVNPAAVSMFGLGSRSDALRRGSLLDFNLRYPDGRPIPPEDMPYARALRGETAPDYLALGRHLITSRDIDLSIAVAPIESNGIVGAVLVMRDITALQELDRKKDEFLSVASHELRTPLTTIKGYSQLLAQTVNDLEPSDRTTYLQAVLGEIERMMGLISELLDVSRIETNRLQVHRQQVEWIGFLEQQTTSFRVQHPGREVAFRCSQKEVEVTIDPDRMRQVIDNLLTNASKYSPDGSPIEISVAVDGNSVKTHVADRGIGIPEDELTQLFERFHRARNVSSRYYGGLGLGLYIAKAIAEAHGGTITVRSEEGAGSTFTLSIPLS